jgi:hypothetical protein
MASSRGQADALADADDETADEEPDSDTEDEGANDSDVEPDPEADPDTDADELIDPDTDDEDFEAEIELDPDTDDEDFEAETELDDGPRADELPETDAELTTLEELPTDVVFEDTGGADLLVGPGGFVVGGATVFGGGLPAARALTSIWSLSLTLSGALEAKSARATVM